MPLVQTEDRGPVRHVILNRAEKRNAFDVGLVEATGAALRAAADAPEVRCVVRVLSDDAVVGLPEVRMGLVPDVGGSSRLPQVVGLGRAKDLVMTGRRIDAREAERMGLANRVAPAGQPPPAHPAPLPDL